MSAKKSGLKVKLKYAQSGVELLIALGVLMMVFFFTLSVTFDEDIDIGQTSSFLEKSNACTEISNLIYLTYTSGGGTKIDVESEYEVTFYEDQRMIVNDLSAALGDSKVAILASEAGKTLKAFYDGVNEAFDDKGLSIDWYKACFSDVGNAGCNPPSNPNLYLDLSSSGPIPDDKTLAALMENLGQYEAVYFEDPNIKYDAVALDGRTYLKVMEDWTSLGNTLILSDHVMCRERETGTYTADQTTCNPPTRNHGDIWPLFTNALHQLDGGDNPVTVVIDPDPNYFVDLEQGQAFDFADGSFINEYKDAEEDRAFWNLQLDGLADDTAYDTITDSEGNVFVVGELGDDWAIVKYEPDGDVLWEITFDDGANDIARGIDVGSNDDIFVVGECENAVSGTSKQDWCVKKLDGDDGSVVWETEDDNGGIDIAYGAAVDSFDDIIVVGECQNVVASNSLKDWCVKKLDGDTGNVIWEDAFDSIDGGAGSRGDDAAYGVDINGNGDVVVVGEGNDLAGGDSGKDWFIMLLDGDGDGSGGGQLICQNKADSGSSSWTRVYDGPNAGAIYALKVLGAYMYAGQGGNAGDGDVLRSSSGAGWSIAFDGPKQAIFSLAGSSFLYSGAGGVAGDGDVWEYNPINGQSRRLYHGSQEGIYSLIYYSTLIYFGEGIQAGDGDVWRGATSGSSWTKVYDSTSKAVTAFYNYKGKLLGGLSGETSGDVLYYDGSIWREWAVSGMNGVTSFAVYPASGSNSKLYAGTRGSSSGKGEVWMATSDTGSQWTKVGELDGTKVLSLAEFNGKLYAGTNYNPGSVWSYDGASWIPEGFGGGSVFSLAVFNSRLYAGTGGADIYRFTPNNNQPDVAYSVAVDSSNSFYVAGYGTGSQKDLWVKKFNSNCQEVLA